MNPYSPPAPPQAYLDAPPGYGAPRPMAAGGVTDLAIEMLQKTRPWVMFLSILSFILSAFMLLAGLLMVGVGMMASGGSAEKGMQAMIGVIYLPLSALYIYPAIKMWMYGSAIGRLVASRSTADLEEALGQQKSFWKFAGISAIVMIGFYIVFFIGAIIWGMAMASKI